MVRLLHSGIALVGYFSLAVNGVFDRATHHLYPARVLNHQVVRGKRITQYDLVLADWQQPAGRITIEVGEALYDKLDESLILIKWCKLKPRLAA